MRYWIRDKAKTALGAPLGKLVRRMHAVSSGAAPAGCELVVRAAHGQGTQIEHLAKALAQQGRVPVSFELLEELSRAPEHWISDLDVECVSPTSRARFGLHHGALFIEAPRDVTLQLVTPFKDIHPDPNWLGQRCA